VPAVSLDLVMYVCHCKRVTDRKVRATIESGAHDCDEVALQCGAGSRCGGCIPAIEELLAQICARVAA
jgi:bacterioferritin-associated ferredoxin